MKSNPSSLTSSRKLLSRFDPSVAILPIFIGLLRAAPIVPFIAMFLSPDFGLTNDSAALNGWWLAPIGAIGFWAVRGLPKVISDPRVYNIILLLLGVGCWIAWMVIEPGWPIEDVLRDPMSMVSGRGQFGWTFIVTIGFWLFTLRLALDEREQSPEGVRGITVRSLVAIMAAIVLAAIIGGDMGEHGSEAAYVALPVALVAGIGAIGLSEMVSTRVAARRRGATVPGWSRWGRTFLGSAAIVLVITFVAAVVFGPGFLGLVLDTLATIWSGIGTVLLWIMYGFVYVIFWIARAFVWLMNLLFDTSMQPIETPEMGMGVSETQPMEQAEVEPWKYASLARMGGIIALVIVALLVISRFVRFKQVDDVDDPNTERSSVFSGSLLRNQMRNLFRRHGHGDRPRKLDLASEPESVRESMLYLQVLATRLGFGRDFMETPQDFTSRLGQQWPQLEEPLAEIRNRYEHVRYGESEEDRRAVIGAWSQIWAAQQDVPGATG